MFLYQTVCVARLVDIEFCLHPTDFAVYAAIVLSQSVGIDKAFFYPYAQAAANGEMAHRCVKAACAQ